MSPRSAIAVAAAVVVAAALGGCGGSSPASTKPAGTGPAAPGKAVSGRVVFAQHCAICHSITGRLYRTQQGGDLRGLHLPRTELVQFTVEMPVIRSPLTGREVQAVVDYMQSMAHRR